MRGLALGLVVLLVTAASGCGTSHNRDRLPVFPARGTVKFHGHAPNGAFIVLHPVGGDARTPDGKVIHPRGSVRPDGTFSLTSFETNDGAPVGDYKITVELRKVTLFPNGKSGPGPNLVPKQYTRPETSPLRVQVAAGANELPPIVLNDLQAPDPTKVGSKAVSQAARGL